jgi:hypothetical protein
VRGFVYNVFENKYCEDKGNGVWAPANIDDIHRALQVVYGMKEAEDRNAIIIQIRKEAQIHQQARIAGCPAGIFRDKQGNPYLSLQNHKMVFPKRVIGRLFGR